MQVMKKEKMEKLEAFIRTYNRDNGVSPSYRQIAEGTDLPLTTVTRYLHFLRDNGSIDLNCRSITTRQEKQTIATVPGEMSVPLLGSVSCGLPKLAEENIEEYVHLPVSLFGQGDFYLLRANGNSMIDAGINKGDLVLIRQSDTADPGQIVVALVGEEATLKRYYPEPEKHRIRLHPENAQMEDIYVDHCIIQGVAKNVIKSL